jgi:hypothetical protein
LAVGGSFDKKDIKVHFSETHDTAKYGRLIPPWKTIGKKNVMRIWRKKEKESELKRREARGRPFQERSEKWLTERMSIVE